MSYGDPGWYDWLLPEEEGLKHIKAAQVAFNYLSDVLIPEFSKHQDDSDSLLSFSYDAGIQTFDTADVGIFKI